MREREVGQIAALHGAKLSRWDEVGTSNSSIAAASWPQAASLRPQAPLSEIARPPAPAETKPEACGLKPAAELSPLQRHLPQAAPTFQQLMRFRQLRCREDLV